MRRIISGFNHNIPFDGELFHVQTEFLGSKNPHAETQVFLDGSVVASRTTDCGDLVELDDGQKQIVLLLRRQQMQVIRELIAGKLLRPEAPQEDTIAPLPLPDGWEQAFERLGTPVDCSESDLSFRRSLVRLYPTVDPERAPTEDELPVRLRGINTCIAVLDGKSPRNNFRDHELAEVLMRQSECVDWIGQDSPSFETGLRIWEAFAAVSKQLLGISNRVKYLRHDYLALKKVCVTLFEAGVDPPSEHVDDESYELLHSAFGRDREIDDLLERPLQVRLARDWEAPVKRVLAELESRLVSALRGLVRADG